MKSILDMTEETKRALNVLTHHTIHYVKLEHKE